MKFDADDKHVDERDDPLETRLLTDDGGFSSRLSRKNIEAFGSDNHERFDSPSLGYNSASKKRTGNERKLKKAHDNENEKKRKSCQGTCAQMEENNFKATDDAFYTRY